MPFTEKESNLAGAAELGFVLSIKALNTRGINPLWRLMNALTGKNMAFNALERAADHNSALARQTIRDFIHKR